VSDWIRKLSHELHSSTLVLIGLAEAVKLQQIFYSALFQQDVELDSPQPDPIQ
jgi:hypothetical protein